MMSARAIIALSEQAAGRAAQRNRKPFRPSQKALESLGSEAIRNIPSFGCYVPDLWERVPENLYSGEGSWFVDKTGVDDRPALSIKRFCKVLVEYCRDNPDHGFAVVEEGPFQVYVNAFRPQPPTECKK